ncbi:MAG: PEGA domain-containing protein, partial [Bradymonadaceae bacterium]
RKQVGKDDRINLMPTFRSMTQSSGGSGGSNAAIQEAQTQYTSGIGLLESGNYEKAGEKFSRAVETLHKHIADLKNFDVYTDALSNLARAYWETGHNYDARKSIREFAHLRPDATLDPEKFPSGLREIFIKEVEKVEKAGSGTLVIEAESEGAQVWIDGQKRGETPLTVEDVTFGYHYLVVRKPGSGVWSKKMQVRGRGKKQTYKAKLQGEQAGEANASDKQKKKLPAFYTELMASIKDGNFGTDLKPYLDELAKRTEVDFISWVVMVKKETEYVAAPFVYRVSDGMIVQPENVAFDFELANLTVGVNSLSTSVVDTVLNMPEDAAVTSVSLADEKKEKQKAMAEADQQSESTSGGQTQDQTSEDSGGGDDGTVNPPPEPTQPTPSDKNRTWTYLGIGGAVLLVGGLAAGGAFLFTDSGGGTKPDSFTANVEW